MQSLPSSVSLSQHHFVDFLILWSFRTFETMERMEKTGATAGVHRPIVRNLTGIRNVWLQLPGRVHQNDASPRMVFSPILIARGVFLGSDGVKSLQCSPHASVESVMCDGRSRI